MSIGGHLRRRAQGHHGQDGFALMVVLAVIALTSVIVVALVGLAFTSAQVASSQSEATRETRAADGALESAVATMAGSGDSTTCPGIRSGSVVRFDNGTPGSDDDDDVVVSCGDANVDLDPAAPLGGNDVKIVGDDGPTLTASGSSAVRFDADVSVRRGADATSTDPAGPAVDVTGQYVQGDAGPGGSGTACTELDPAGGQAARSVRDRDSAPECGSGAAANLSVAPQQLVNFDDPVAAPPQAVPLTCPGGDVVELAPGRYDAVQTSALNQLMSGSCPNKVFWFKASSSVARPGVFAFDANPNRSGGAALVIADPTARVIFGQPAGGASAAAAAAATFPEACDRGVPGASIQLSGRMALRHLAGRMAVCPAWNGTAPLPALVQVPTAAMDPITVAASSGDFTLPGNANGGPALLAAPEDLSIQASAAFSCPLDTATYTCSKSLSASFANVPAVSSMSSVRIAVASKEWPPAPWPTVQRRVVISLTSATGAPICTTAPLDGGRTNWSLSSYDLTSDPACRSALAGKPGSLLEDATANVRYTYGPDGCAATFDWVFGWVQDCGESLSLRGIRLIVDAPVADAGQANGSGGLSTPTHALADDSAYAFFDQESCNIPQFPCTYDTPGTTHDLTVEDIDAGDRFVGPPRTLRLLVKNRPASTVGDSWVSDPIDDSRTDIQVTLADGRSCTTSSSGYSHSAQESQYDLLSGGTCAGTINDLSQLQGARIRIRHLTGCAWVGSTRATPGEDGRCATVALPQYQYVALIATSSAVQQPPPPSVVTVDVDRGTDFHAFGAATLPRSKVEARWNGAALVDEPLFANSLVVGSLDSQMATGASMGIVCCERPQSGLLRLEASVDGDVRAVAVVSIAPRTDGLPGHTVGVDDWELCVRRACGLPAGPPTPP